MDLQLRQLELSEGVLDRCSDSTGAVIGLFQRGVDGLVSLAKAAGTRAEVLVEHAVDLLHENGYGQFDGLIPALAPVLQDAGLLRLEEVLLERGGVDRFLMEQPALATGVVVDMIRALLELEHAAAMVESFLPMDTEAVF